VVESGVLTERSLAQAPADSHPAGDDLRCLVTISRRHEGDARTRQVIARIDDAPAVTLMYGDTVTVAVQPGRHLLRANNTLIWKRVPFVAEPGEHLEFILINRPGRLTLGFLAILGVAPLYLGIEKRSVV
jgi:Flp pilus assembly protein TadG